MQSNNEHLKLWKVAIRELYYLDLLDENTFISMYHYGDHEYDYDSLNDSDKIIVDMVYDTLKNIELMAEALHEEVDVIARGILPKDKQVFKKMWLSYLLDCHDRGLITDADFSAMAPQIDFSNSDWSERELENANHVVDMIRFTLIEKNPASIEYIDNPSFDLLMYANNLEYV